MGSTQQPLFVLMPAAYLLAMGIAYKLGSKIEDYAVNAAYNWSAKWVLFIGFLYLSGKHMNSAFVFAMFLYILINTTLSPTTFLSKDRVNT